ncbi:MAG: hypothetical protein JWQ41_2961 [Variovorax sp.]|nr:hypothetical protein [Variovorax sp.]
MTSSTPDKDTSLKSLEAELDRSIEELDEKKEAEERAEAARQLAESKDDPAPLSDYKKAEAIKKDAV